MMKAIASRIGSAQRCRIAVCRGIAPHSFYLFKTCNGAGRAYGMLLRSRRQELHARVAAVLEKKFAELVERQPELLAHHLTARAIPRAPSING